MTLPSNSVLDVTYGEGSEVRFKVHGATAPAIGARPADMNTAALYLPELTSSDAPVSVANRNSAPTMYGSGHQNRESGGNWATPRPGEKSWTMSLQGNVQPTEPQRVAMNTLIESAGKYLWVERRRYGETKWQGGWAWVSGSGEPIPVGDSPVTFSANLTGYGPKYSDTSNIA